MVESAVGVVSVSAVVRSAAAVSAAAVAIAASVVIANGAAHRAAAASGAAIASVAAAVAIDQCVLVATNSSTYAAVLATWIDLWACTATCAICHTRTWTAIRWTWSAIARADGRACWNTSGRLPAQARGANFAALCRAGAKSALGRKPVPRAQDQEGVGSVWEQYKRTLSAVEELHNVRAGAEPNTHVCASSILAQLLRNARERCTLADDSISHSNRRIL